MSKPRKKKDAEQQSAAAQPTPEQPTIEQQSAAAESGPDLEASAEAAPAPDPLQVMTAERDDFKEKWLRVVAELDNVRKRSVRELQQSRRFAQAEVLRGTLEVQDNLERALQSVPGAPDTGAPDSFREGVELIVQRVRSLLNEHGVTPMEVLAAEFDPVVHEAVGQLPREGVESGVVIEVVQQGYHFGDMVLRPARVIISA